MADQSPTQSGSVSNWIRGAKAGDESAVARLWERYNPALVALARKKLSPSARRVADEEDLAASVFLKFCDGAREGQFEDLHHRDELWRLLLSITKFKAMDHGRYYGRAKRAPSTNQMFDSRSDVPVEQIESKEPPPELLAAVEEKIDYLLGQLRNDETRRIALLYLEGQPTHAIAQEMKFSQRSIQRKIDIIRKQWARELEP